MAAAAATAFGLPVRLVRLTLGVLALLAMRPRGSDLVALAALLSSLYPAFLWIAVVLYGAPSAAAVLLALATGLLVLSGLGARRASQARHGLLLATLARRADLVDPEQLEAFLSEQRRRAPWAWSSPGRSILAGAGITTDSALERAGSDGVSGPGTGPPRVGRQRAHPRRPAVSGRAVVVVLAGMLAVGALTVLVLNLDPGLLPGVAEAPMAPQVGRVGAGFAAAAAVGGIAVVAHGLRGRRSGVLVLAAVLALSGAGGAATWLRLVHDPQAEPIRIEAADLEVGQWSSCPVRPSTWAQPVIIDLQGIDQATVDRLRTRQGAAGLEADRPAISIDCQRALGRITVLLPADEEHVNVWATSMDGSSDGRHAGHDDAVLEVYGSVLVGEVEILAAGQDDQEGTE